MVPMGILPIRVPQLVCPKLLLICPGPRLCPLLTLPSLPCPVSGVAHAIVDVCGDIPLTDYNLLRDG